MARRPADRPEEEVLSEKDLKELRHRLAHLSLTRAAFLRGSLQGLPPDL